LCEAGLLASKRRLRRTLRRLARPAGSAAELCATAAMRHFARSPELLRARQVAIFAALPDEMPSRPLFALLRRLGRTPLLPRARPGKALDFAPLARWDELRRADFGLLEPPAGAPSVVLGPGDLVLVPGLGFDRRGRRLGRGGGHYDRTFPPGVPAPDLLALAFSCQLVDEVPVGPHDRRMDGILTERGMLRVAGVAGGLEVGDGR